MTGQLSPSNNLKELVAGVGLVSYDQKGNKTTIFLRAYGNQPINDILTLILDSLLAKPEIQDEYNSVAISKETPETAYQIGIRNGVRAELRAVIEGMKS